MIHKKDGICYLVYSESPGSLEAKGEIQINSTTQLKLTTSTLEIKSGEKKLTVFSKTERDGNVGNLKNFLDSLEAKVS